VGELAGENDAMRESRIMLIQYITAVVALFLVGLHLLMQGVLVPYESAISFQRVLSVYRAPIDGSLLEILLIVVLAHGFNGLRIILLEWKQSSAWTRAVNVVVLVILLATIAYGTRTIILAVTGVQTG
jgi:succinate dehydrogenase / fumarate reductase membrane anchor subunit